MQRIILWIKTNKVFAAVILLSMWLAWPRIETFLYYNTGINLSRTELSSSMGYESLSPDFAKVSSQSSYYPIEEPYAPTDTSDRMVVRNASMAMLVNDVVETETKIMSHVVSVGGYLVSSDISRPTESPYATLSLRIPSDNLNAALEFFDSLSVKVTSQSVTGRDVTDQYTDIQAHIESLTKTKTRYETIRDAATEVSDLIMVTQEITNIQNQIDSYVGQQQYLEQTARFSLVSIDMSTDELALPYAPEDPFRPAVIFKTAVRSVLTLFQNIAESLIWFGVYAVIWVPLSLIGLWWYRRSRSPRDTT